MSSSSIDRTENAGPSAEANVCPKTGALWGYSLAFYDSTLERRYQSEMVHSHHQHEKLLHLVCLLGGFMVNCVHWGDLSSAGRALLFTQVFLVPAITSLMVWFRKEKYMQFRAAMIIFVTTTHPLIISLLILDNPASQAWHDVLACIWVKSPAYCALLLCTNWSLRFRSQVFLQLMTLPGLISWASRFCASCAASEINYEEGFGTLGAVLGYFSAFVSLIPLPFRIPGCFEVTLGIVLIAGLLLPILAVYLLDLHRQAAFAKKHLPSNMDVAIDLNASDSWSIGVMYFVAAVEVVVIAVVNGEAL
ncbi:hypothetical protein BSKO_06258 [Bryopsis sp. KO-2023]|nr:hypothetical protein BSKO_06258 [Bryopsis sp. KO-2023]